MPGINMSDDFIETYVKVYKEPQKRGRSFIKIGNTAESYRGTGITIESNVKFNWFQKKMWKYLLNIDIEDIKEEK